MLASVLRTQVIEPELEEGLGLCQDCTAGMLTYKKREILLSIPPSGVARSDQLIVSHRGQSVQFLAQRSDSHWS